uniref:Uncharacterized protein n=1 Tax=Arundo donax TaxID=35708 RepID=A0A0A9CC47_ARUDO
MFGRKPISLGKHYMPNLLIPALRMLPVDHSRSATAMQVHSVNVWRASLKSLLRIGSLMIEQEDASRILPWIALVWKTRQVQQTCSTP